MNRSMAKETYRDCRAENRLKPFAGNVVMFEKVSVSDSTVVVLGYGVRSGKKEHATPASASASRLRGHIARSRAVLQRLCVFARAECAHACV
jgi:hypothetical protein